MKVHIQAVKVGDRFRKDMGDLNQLANSISTHGLLQPIGVNQDNELLFGERRLRACRDILGLTEIEAIVFDVHNAVETEHDENVIRKDFSPSERLAISEAIESEMQKRQGQRTDQLPGTCPEVNETREVIAKKAGFGSARTRERVRTVIENGAPELVEAMDQNVVSIHTASKIAKEPPEKQRELISDEEIRERWDHQKQLFERYRQNMSQVQLEREVIDAFTAIRDTPVDPEEFARTALKGERRDVLEAIPQVRRFIAAFEGGSNAKLRAV